MREIRKRYKKIWSICLIIAMFVNLFSGVSFAGSSDADKKERTWTFDTAGTDVYWSDINERWELRMTSQMQYSTMMSDTDGESWLPEEILVSAPEEILNIATTSEATKKSEKSTTAYADKIATGSNASAKSISETLEKEDEGTEEEDLPDIELINDLDLSSLHTGVTHSSKTRKNTAIFFQKRISTPSTASNADLEDAVSIPIVWKLEPFYDFLSSYLEEMEPEYDEYALDDENAKEIQEEKTASVSEAFLATPSVPRFKRTEYTIFAEPAEEIYTWSGQTDGEIALTIVLTSNESLSEDTLAANRIETLSPDGLTLNLFDYWNTTQDAADYYGWGSANNQREWATDFWNKNIGKNHVLQFLGAESDSKFGKWNSWVGNSESSMQGMVQKKLVNGYPALNISETDLSATTELAGRDGNESLEYLFNPDVEHDGKESFSNVKGLLKPSGAAVSYACTKNFAEFVRTPNDGSSDGYFNVYNIPAIQSNWNVMGQFFPFASLDKVFTENDDGTLTANEINCQKFTHFHGMSGSMTFTKKSRGVVRYNGSSSNLHFTFSGNDEMWVYVDGVLVGDGGGNSDEKVVTIDFATGAVEVRRASGHTAASTYDTTIRDCFETAGENVNQFSGNTFADNTEHTLQFFFLERGSNASFFSLDFNTVDLEAIDREILLKNRIQSIMPENIRMNLHDYWVTGKNDRDYFKSSSEEAATRFWERGINKNHLLQFVNTILTLNNVGETKNGFGKFNEWTGNQGIAYEGLVKRTLKNGYPQLDISEELMEKAKLLPNTEEKREESLAYLFDPDYEHDGKESYTNVGGLLKEDGDGFYSYNGRENYAEFVKTDDHTGRLNIYNTPAVLDNKGVLGQFFPFNTANEVFSITNDDTLKAGNLTCQMDEINHFFGVDMAVDFEQPANGKISNGNVDEDMQFYFTGDDDVWVFVDGVLISDLGGVHDELYTTINFATGEIIRDRTYDPTTTSKRISTIKAEFEKAGMDTSGFQGDTFADYTAHTMQFFYLERGSNASNLTMRFNLQYHPSNRLQKIDQDGNGLDGAVFDLYAAKKEDDRTFIVDPDYAEPLLENIAVSETGFVNLNNPDGTAFDFSKYEHYILREKEVPDGYVGTPDVWITSDPDIAGKVGLQTGSAALYVENREQTGASIAHIMDANALLVDITQYNGTDAGLKTENGNKLMVFAVPYVRNLQSENTGWYPFYGSEKRGYRTTEATEKNEAVVEAIIGSICEHYHDESAADWGFEYDASTAQISANVNPIPYAINRYGAEDADIAEGTDLTIQYYHMDLSMFTDFKGLTADECADAIVSMVRKKITTGEDMAEITAAVHAVAQELFKKGASVKQLSKNSFTRKTQVSILIPNRERKLTISKVNEAGDPLAKAEFSIFSSKADAENGTNALYSGKTGADGKLIFTPQPMNGEIDKDGTAYAYAALGTNEDGSTKIYYFKETKPPALYRTNPSIMEIIVSKDGLTVSGKDDKIRIQGTPGVLVYPLRKYATGINQTLKNIIWNADRQNVELLYNKDGAYIQDEKAANFTGTENTQTGTYTQSGTGWREGVMTGLDLTGENLSGVFTREVLVEVTDQYRYATLTINKHINETYKPFGEATFLFEITGNGQKKTVILTIPAGQNDASTEVQLEYGADYRVREIGVSRYHAAKEPISIIRNAKLDGTDTVTVLLSTNKEAELTFNNELTQYEKFSHTATVVNHVQAENTGENVSDPEEIPAELIMQNKSVSLMNGWKFHLDDAVDTRKNAYDDNTWSPVVLPYDSSLKRKII